MTWTPTRQFANCLRRCCAAESTSASIHQIWRIKDESATYVRIGEKWYKKGKCPRALDKATRRRDTQVRLVYLREDQPTGG